MIISKEKYNKLPEEYKKYFEEFKNRHPTVKSLGIMEYLVRLVTRKGGIVLDPFGGSGSTALACIKEGMNFILIEREEEYIKIAESRIKHFQEEYKEVQSSL